ncbi:hypothetical protein E3N88_32574 [Mikania micrantha]|uniref:Leucine-rich repeat-containing N-terminal plant-type domain-containing protein n=1 Tax=Mikania micrantha TaxID=192012 RepID=A0A5N6M8V4_9ASTR|nr:hypothetical protein E3N88_32574 [Mikania micrantha]
MSHNDLTGKLHRSFAGLQIQDLYINNQVHGLSGTIDILSLMTWLNEAWLDFNSFTGAISSLSNCTDLFDLQLRDKEFTRSFKCDIHVDLRIGSNNFCLSKLDLCNPQVTTLLEITRSIRYPMLA